MVVATAFGKFTDSLKRNYQGNKDRMLLYSISFLLGVCIIQQLAVLPVLSLFLSLPLCLLLTIYCRLSPYVILLRYVSVFLIGAFWATLVAQQYLVSRLPEVLAGVNIVIQGKIIDIPVVKGKVQRFVLDVDTFHSDDENVQKIITNDTSLPRRLRLSWYYSKVEPNAGESWQFQVRLKPPHGFLNPAGFDYEAWLYQQGIHATGYVRKSALNVRLEPANAFSIDGLRQLLFKKMTQSLSDSPFRGLLAALAVGNRALISKQQWDDLIKTGTNHLMAISGLHIGLAAAFGYWLTRRCLPAVVMTKVPAQQISISIGVIFALMYALLAGLSIPTQRALIMLLCVAGAMLLKRHFRTTNVLSLALFLVLLIDPVSVLSTGFWFSFLAVASIFYLFNRKSEEAIPTENLSMTRHLATLWKWGGLQLVVALVLFPLSLMLFQQSSLIAPLANFILVPFISFLVVPLVLVSIVLFAIYQPIAVLILQLANSLLALIWPFIHFLAVLPLSHWVQHVSSLGVVILAMTGIVIVFADVDWRLRMSGLLFIIPLFIPANEPPLNGGFEMQLLDVGQGLAVIIQTQNHVLVYDTGARFSDELDSGQAVVLPALRALDVDFLDMVVISHGDNDHIGGAKSILAAFPQTVIVGQDIQSLNSLRKLPCTKGNNWTWDGVYFEFLHPDKHLDKKRNNHSCVLKITGSGGSLLLTGDIEKKVEKQLLKTSMEKLNVDVLVVPHHGSKTSSSQAWLEAVKPKIVLFAAGYRNRYRLPANDVVKRYQALMLDTGVILISTASSGAVWVRFHPFEGIIIKDQYRINHAKYWHHQPPEFN